MCIQPCCHNRAIYASLGFIKYKFTGRKLTRKWVSSTSFNSFDFTYGGDVDVKNNKVYSSGIIGQIRRYSSLTGGPSSELIATRSGPGTSAQWLTEFRVYPDLQQIVLTEFTNTVASGVANLLLLPYSGATPVTLFTFTNRISSTLGQTTPLSGAINLRTSKAVFTQVALISIGPSTYQVDVKQCDLDGSNITTLCSFGTYTGLQAQTFVMGDVDYLAGTYVVSEGNGFGGSTARKIYSIPWAGGSPTTLVTGSDVLPYFVRPITGGNVANIGFFDVQILDDRRIWFRAFSVTGGSPTSESQIFSMTSTGSDLRREFADSDFSDWPGSRRGGIETLVFGEKLNSRRGRLPL